MAKSCSILDKENLRGIFNKVMLSHQLNYQDIKKERAKVSISDKGQFYCDCCAYQWTSNFSWITFDLSDMQITYRWKMKCKFCFLPWEPTFSVEQIELMYEKAVCWYTGEQPTSHINIGNRASRERRQPHLPLLCEKCKWGLTICWQRPYN